MTDLSREYDLLVVGGGINGAGIACDAAGRGLSVLLCEQGDLAGETSSASSKMIHGGLRYLEHFEFRLVREALAEREVLQARAPHLIKPLRVLLPHTSDARPAWMIRLGLFLYDHLSTRQTLPGCETIRLDEHPAGGILDPSIGKAFAYSDCWVDDARLVIGNAMAASDAGATILTRHRVEHCEARAKSWRASVRDVETSDTVGVAAKVLINAAGPRVEEFRRHVGRQGNGHHVRMVKGSHIVVPSVHDGPEALLLQNSDDGRVIFVLPFENRYSLIGTTDVGVASATDGRAITDEETAYLCTAVNRYLRRKISADDVVWSFAGVRPLLDDGHADPAAVTRDYSLELDTTSSGAVMLSVFGGKITTYRRLAEAALAKLAGHLPAMGPAWTATAALPGGDMAVGAGPDLAADLAAERPGIDQEMIAGLIARHGTLCAEVLGDAQATADLGEVFGGGLTAREIEYMVAREWAQTAEDIIWRRTKAGLAMDEKARRAVETYLDQRGRHAA